MSTVAESPVGKPLLWLIADRADRPGRLAGGGGAALAQRLVGVRQDADKALRKSGNAIVKAAIYIALAVLAIRFATGGGQSSSQHSRRPPRASSAGRPASSSSAPPG